MTGPESPACCEDRFAIVTGGCSGIGREITRRLANHGWHCVVADLSPGDVDGHGDVGDDKVRQITCDITIDADRRMLMDVVASTDMPLRLLVNCAAISSTSPLFDQQEEKWQRELSTNVVAMAILSTLAMDRMRSVGGGSIVNIGSVYGRLGVNGHLYEDLYPQDGGQGPRRGLAYHASKGAVAALTRELAAVGGQWNVRVNTLSPGMIATPGRRLPPGVVDNLTSMTPLGRMGLPCEIAAAVEFLASDDATFVTGADWVVDGGWSIW